MKVFRLKYSLKAFVLLSEQYRKRGSQDKLKLFQEEILNKRKREKLLLLLFNIRLFFFCQLVFACSAFFVLQKSLLNKFLFFCCVNLLWSSVRILSFCENLLFSVRIFSNPSCLWESFLIYDHLWESLLIYDHLWESFRTSLWK